MTINSEAFNYLKNAVKVSQNEPLTIIFQDCLFKEIGPYIYKSLNVKKLNEIKFSHSTIRLGLGKCLCDGNDGKEEILICENEDFADISCQRLYVSIL